MTTTHQKPRARRRIAAATIVAAGALAAGALSPAAPANAANTYLALAYRLPFHAGQISIPHATGIGKSGDSADRARANALQNCTNSGGTNADLVGASGTSFTTTTA